MALALALLCLTSCVVADPKINFRGKLKVWDGDRFSYPDKDSQEALFNGKKDTLVSGGGGDGDVTPSTAERERVHGEIPVRVARRLNEIKDEAELYKTYDLDPDDDAFYKSVDTEKVVPLAKYPGCVPYNQIVSLPKPGPLEQYYPSCVKVEQCGGCCNHERLRCQPTLTEEVKFQVVKIVYNQMKNKIYSKGHEVKTVQKHKKCKCDCIIKEENCNELQEYNEGECRCVCKSNEAKIECERRNETKFWNSTTCGCECRLVHQCSFGQHFNYASCKCEY